MRTGQGPWGQGCCVCAGGGCTCVRAGMFMVLWSSSNQRVRTGTVDETNALRVGVWRTPLA